MGASNLDNEGELERSRTQTNDKKELQRQIRQIFELQKRQAEQWFLLRLRMGYVSICVLSSVVICCLWILLNSSTYSHFVVKAAAAVLFVDIIGLVANVWKIVLDPGSIAQVRTITEVQLLGPEEEKK